MCNLRNKFVLLIWEFNTAIKKIAHGLKVELCLLSSWIGRCVNVDDAYSCQNFNSKIDEMTGFRTRNLLCCPIVDISGKNIAVLQVVLRGHALVHLTPWQCLRCGT